MTITIDAEKQFLLMDFLRRFARIHDDIYNQFADNYYIYQDLYITREELQKKLNEFEIPDFLDDEQDSQIRDLIINIILYMSNKSTTRLAKEEINTCQIL